MKVYTVKFSAPREVDEATRAQFEAEALRLWRYLLDGTPAYVTRGKPMVLTAPKREPKP